MAHSGEGGDPERAVAAAVFRAPVAKTWHDGRTLKSERSPSTNLVNDCALFRVISNGDLLWRVVSCSLVLL
jgi:hypothetical protein